jgi:hypothetical protein
MVGHLVHTAGAAVGVTCIVCLMAVTAQSRCVGLSGKRVMAGFRWVTYNSRQCDTTCCLLLNGIVARLGLQLHANRRV